MGISYGLAMLLVFLALLLFSALRILREYERGVVFQLGRFWKVKGPGLVLVIPAIQQMVRIDLRTIVLDDAAAGCDFRDNVSVKVSAVVYFRVLDPQKAIIQVENCLAATSQLAQTTLRAVLGKHEAGRDARRARAPEPGYPASAFDAQTDAWGIKVANVEIKHVDLNESMVRAIARQAEAERERGAKVIHAGASCKPRRNSCRRRRCSAGRWRHAVALHADPRRDRRRQEFDHRLPDADRTLRRQVRGCRAAERKAAGEEEEVNACGL